MRDLAGKGRASGAIVLALCSLVFAVPLLAEDAGRTALVLTIDNESWTSDLLISDAVGETEIDLNGEIGGLPAIPLPHDGSAIVRDFGALNPSTVALRRVRITKGDATLQTQATYRDALGDFNTVTIPEIVPLLAEGAHDTLRFARIESTAERSTYLAMFAATPLILTLSYRAGDGTAAGADEIYVDKGFTLYECRRAVEIGTLDLRRSTHFGCPGCDGELRAIAFVGYRGGGGPRVELPAVITSDGE